MKSSFACLIALIVTGWFFTFSIKNCDAHPASKPKTKYLMFQVFVYSHENSSALANFPPSQNIEALVDDITNAIGTTGSASRRLGFIPGPIAFNNSDDQVRRLIKDSFAI